MNMINDLRSIRSIVNEMQDTSESEEVRHNLGNLVIAKIDGILRSGQGIEPMINPISLLDPICPSCNFVLTVSEFDENVLSCVNQDCTIVYQTDLQGKILANVSNELLLSNEFSKDQEVYGYTQCAWTFGRYVSKGVNEGEHIILVDLKGGRTGVYLLT